MQFDNNIMAKPFLKWAGGKTQLLEDVYKRLPSLVESEDFTFIEPFVGSGAVLFSLINNFSNLTHSVINDTNIDLINLYRTIKNNSSELIKALNVLQSDFLAFEHKSLERKEFYYNIRDKFNSSESDVVIRSAYFIFLNRTCFNGLYRVNTKNKFNVPMGDYKNPTILSEGNIYSAKRALQNVEILHGDYTKILDYCEQKTFVYLDPPYKPISQTSNFNSYGADLFDDNEQIRLKEFCDTLDSKGVKWMLSNSDVRSGDNDDEFFDELYKNYNIQRVLAKRNINSKSGGRGQITEILVTNY